MALGNMECALLELITDEPEHFPEVARAMSGRTRRIALELAKKYRNVLADAETLIAQLECRA